MQVPFSPPDISEKEIEEVMDALRSGWITTGPKTKELERQIASFCHTKKAACLNSATAAMELCLRALGIGSGDEVITCAYTYTASASVICHVGACPVLVDCQEDSYEMDYQALEDAVSDKTKAIIVVDIAGKMVDYPKIFEVLEACKDRFSPRKDTLQELFSRPILIADAAHSFGAELNKKMSGEYADFTSFSFHAVKNFTTAEGGALVWKEHPGLNDDAFYQTLMQLSLHGQTKDALSKSKAGSWEYDIVAPLYKCNMTDIHAALGLAQLPDYPRKLKRRRVIIERYNQAVQEINAELSECADTGEPRVKLAYLDHYDERISASQKAERLVSKSSGHLYMLELQGASLEERNALIEAMGQEGIACNVHYKPLPLLTAYKNLGFEIQDFPRAYKRYTQELSLPLHTCLREEQLAYVCVTLKRLCKELFC